VGIGALGGGGHPAGADPAGAGEAGGAGEAEPVQATDPPATNSAMRRNATPRRRTAPLCRDAPAESAAGGRQQGIGTLATLAPSRLPGSVKLGDGSPFRLGGKRYEGGNRLARPCYPDVGAESGTPPEGA